MNLKIISSPIIERFKNSPYASRRKGFKDEKEIKLPDEASKDGEAAMYALIGKQLALELVEKKKAGDDITKIKKEYATLKADKRLYDYTLKDADALIEGLKWIDFIGTPFDLSWGVQFIFNTFPNKTDIQFEFIIELNAQKFKPEALEKLVDACPNLKILVLPAGTPETTQKEFQKLRPGLSCTYFGHP